MTHPSINPYLTAGIPYPCAVLWDMDGVICDNGQLHYQAWVETFQHLRGEHIPEELFKRTFGMNNFGALTLLLGQEPTAQELDLLAEEKERIFRQLILGNVAFLPGVEEWLREFHCRGIPMAIASSAPQENIDALRAELGLDRYLSVFVSANEMPSKPSPAVFLKAAEVLGVAPQQCVVVEDAVAGVAAGRAGGMQVIAVTTTNPPDLLTEAHLVVDTLVEIDLPGWAADCPTNFQPG